MGGCVLIFTALRSLRDFTTSLRQLGSVTFTHLTILRVLAEPARSESCTDGLVTDNAEVESQGWSGDSI